MVIFFLSNNSQYVWRCPERYLQSEGEMNTNCHEMSGALVLPGTSFFFSVVWV